MFARFIQKRGQTLVPKQVRLKIRAFHWSGGKIGYMNGGKALSVGVTKLIYNAIIFCGTF